LVARELLAEGISVRFRAGGHSMTPTIADHEILIVAPARAAEIAVADVVLSATSRRATAHRVLSVDARADGELALTTCGDAALETDRPVAAAEVLGRVVGIERAGRQIAIQPKAGAFGRRALVAALELRRAVRRWRARAWLPSLAPARVAD
jgi:hypothetical protein